MMGWLKKKPHEEPVKRDDEPAVWEFWMIAYMAGVERSEIHAWWAIFQECPLKPDFYTVMDYARDALQQVREESARATDQHADHEFCDARLGCVPAEQKESN